MVSAAKSATAMVVSWTALVSVWCIGFGVLGTNDVAFRNYANAMWLDVSI